MINTYNESKLHKTIKTLYAAEYNGQTEVELYGHIYDIVSDDNTIIEIQTKNLSKLLAKILDTLEKGHKVILVYPLVIQKWIELYDEENTLISKRKSPKVSSIYDFFDELTGIFPVLLHENFRLDVLEITMIETRIKTNAPVQSKNGRRRFRKNWLKTGKELKEILQTRTFSSAGDYLKLLPQTLPMHFSAKDLELELKKDKTLPISASKNAHLILWVLVRMELILEAEIKNRRHYYKINQTYIKQNFYLTFSST